MFERNRIDHHDRVTLPVEIELADGHILIGRLLAPNVRTLADELNHAGGFVEFESLDGDRMFLPKSSLLIVQSKTLPRAEQLSQRGRDDNLDPHAVLGVARDAKWDDIRAAYHAKAKTYHPDKFANLDLPPEMLDYVAAVARRLNMAYEMLETARSERLAREEKRAAFGAGTARPAGRPIGRFGQAPVQKPAN